MKWKKYTWFLAFTIGRCIENRQFFVYFWNIDIWATVVWLQHIYIQYRAGGKKKKMSAHSILASHSFCIYEFSKSSYHELYIWNYSSCIIFNLSFHVMCRKGIAICNCNMNRCSEWFFLLLIECTIFPNHYVCKNTEQYNKFIRCYLCGWECAGEIGNTLCVNCNN